MIDKSYESENGTLYDLERLLNQIVGSNFEEAKKIFYSLPLDVKTEFVKYSLLKPSKFKGHYDPHPVCYC